MEGIELLVDLHKEGLRQGPGSETTTLKALELMRLPPGGPFRMAELGCGTGAASLALAAALDVQITAVDLFPEFLDVLVERARQRSVSDRITTQACSMDDLPFPAETFDMIWSEGAVYNIGFEQGVAYWHRFLRPGGFLAVSEIIWLAPNPPLEIQGHWDVEYPEMGTASAKMDILERHGYAPTGFFVLPQDCWTKEYYDPLQQRTPAFLKRHNHSAEAREIVEAEKKEIDLYQRYQDWFGYGFFVARKV